MTCRPIVRAYANVATGWSEGETIWGPASVPQPEAACGQGLPIRIDVTSI